MATSCRCLSHNGFLTVRGYEDAQRRRESLGVDDTQLSMYLDKVVSVSASTVPFSHWGPEALIEEQYRRFNHGF